jgi:hypothetical protein
MSEARLTSGAFSLEMSLNSTRTRLRDVTNFHHGFICFANVVRFHGTRVAIVKVDMQLRFLVHKHTDNTTKSVFICYMFRLARAILRYEELYKTQRLIYIIQ